MIKTEKTPVSFLLRTTRPWWWRTCDCAQSNTARTSSAASVSKWFLRPSKSGNNVGREGEAVCRTDSHVSPNRSCMMQADSEKLRQAWIKAVQNSIATAFRDKGDDSEVTDTRPVPVTGFSSKLHERNSKQSPILVIFHPVSHQKLDRKSSTSTGSLDSGGEPKERSLKGESALQKVLVIPGNSCCCDCGQPDPRWASINLGITLCIQCSGIHR